MLIECKKGIKEFNNGKKKKGYYLPVKQMVTNFEPKYPSGESLQTFGCWFWKWPAIIHSWALRKWDC